MSRASLTRLALTSTALMALSPVHAEEPTSRVTRAYVNATAQSDAFERLGATTALALSKTPAVRAFATRMMSEHAASSQKLMAAVSQEGLEPPQPGINGDQSAFLAALQSARGADFDRLYASQQALVHRAALATQQGYAEHGHIATLRAFADEAKEMVRGQITSADQLVANVGAEKD
jgi:putative membrane protein